MCNSTWDGRLIHWWAENYNSENVKIHFENLTWKIAFFLIFFFVPMRCWTIQCNCLAGPGDVFRHDPLLPHQQIRTGIQAVDVVSSRVTLLLQFRPASVPADKQIFQFQTHTCYFAFCIFLLHTSRWSDERMRCDLASVKTLKPKSDVRWFENL